MNKQLTILSRGIKIILKRNKMENSRTERQVSRNEKYTG
jgi:hypothetical protein